MATTNTIIQLKSSTLNTSPVSLNVAEPAYSFVSDKLFIGNPNGTPILVGGGFVANTTFAAFDKANSAFDLANNVAPQIAPAFNTANAAFDKANAAFDLANNVAPQIAPAFNTANAAFDKANAANDLANTKLSNSTGTFAGTLTISGDLITQGNVTLGDASTDTITLNGSTISLGNNQSINSGTLFVDAVNNRVGIGTTSPIYPLHISSSGPLRLERPGSGSWNFNIVNPHITGDTTDLVINSQVASSGFGFVTRNISGSSINALSINKDGFVGINTTNPTSNLHVIGTANLNGVFVDANGNVGLGTTNPKDNTKPVRFNIVPTSNNIGSAIFVTDNNNQPAKGAASGSFISAYVSNDGVYNNWNAISGSANRTITGNPSNGLGFTFYSQSRATANNIAYIGNYFAFSTTIGYNSTSAYNYISRNYVQTNAGVGSLTNFFGYFSDVQTAVGGESITNHYDFYTDNGSLSTNTTITNRYGLYLNADNTSTTNAWGIYQARVNVKNYFAGNIGIGITNPTSNLHVIGTANISSSLTVGSMNVVPTIIAAFDKANTIPNKTATIAYTIDGGGGPIELGLAGIGVQASFNGTIQSITTLADTTGNCVIDIWKGPYDAYPLSNANSITASAQITLNNASKNVFSTLSGWDTSINEGDILQFNVVSLDTIEKLNIIINTEILSKDIATIAYTIDNGDLPIELGLAGIGLQASFNGTIQSVTTLADTTGNCVIDIWKGSYDDYPLSNANSITASTKVTVNNAIKSFDSTLSGWSKSINNGDILQFNVESLDTIKRLSILIKAKKE